MGWGLFASGLVVSWQHCSFNRRDWVWPPVWPLLQDSLQHTANPSAKPREGIFRLGEFVVARVFAYTPGVVSPFPVLPFYWLCEDWTRMVQNSDSNCLLIHSVKSLWMPPTHCIVPTEVVNSESLDFCTTIPCLKWLLTFPLIRCILLKKYLTESVCKK